MKCANLRTYHLYLYSAKLLSRENLNLIYPLNSSIQIYVRKGIQQKNPRQMHICNNSVKIITRWQYYFHEIFEWNKMNNFPFFSKLWRNLNFSKNFVSRMIFRFCSKINFWHFVLYVSIYFKRYMNSASKFLISPYVKHKQNFYIWINKLKEKKYNKVKLKLS